MKTFLAILFCIAACLVAVPDAQAGPLCNRGCDSGNVQAPVQKWPVQRSFQRRPVRGLLGRVLGR